MYHLCLSCNSKLHQTTTLTSIFTNRYFKCPIRESVILEHILVILASYTISDTVIIRSAFEVLWYSIRLIRCLSHNWECFVSCGKFNYILRWREEIAYYAYVRKVGRLMFCKCQTRWTWNNLAFCHLLSRYRILLIIKRRPMVTRGLFFMENIIGGLFVSHMAGRSSLKGDKIESCKGVKTCPRGYFSRWFCSFF